MIVHYFGSWEIELHYLKFFSSLILSHPLTPCPFVFEGGTFVHCFAHFVFLDGGVVRFSLCSSNHSMWHYLSFHPANEHALRYPMFCVFCRQLPVLTKDKQQMRGYGERRALGLVWVCISSCYIVNLGITLVVHHFSSLWYKPWLVSSLCSHSSSFHSCSLPSLAFLLASQVLSFCCFTYLGNDSGRIPFFFLFGRWENWDQKAYFFLMNRKRSSPSCLFGESHFIECP